MANHASHAALPYPIKNARYTVQVPYLDADGDPTDPTTPDTEITKDGAGFGDCAEEVTTITGANGVGYITLSGAETDCSMLALAAKVASGPKATILTMHPRVLPILESGTAQAGAAVSITLASGAAAFDLTGCFVRTTGGTGGGGAGGANNQARKITAYNASTKVATVTPNWETTPDVTTTYDVLLPEGVTIGMIRALNPTTAGRTLDVSAGGEAGVDWANVGTPATVVGLSGTTVKTATDVETDTQDIQTRLPATLSTGRMRSDAEAISASTVAADNVEANIANLDAAISSRATPAQVNTEADTALVDAGVTTTRTGYLDKLNITGNVAASNEVTAIQNNTRVVRVVPEVIERPDSGTQTYRVELFLYDEVGNMEAPDSAPTIELVNQAGVDRSLRLDSTTMALVETGRYRAVYTASVGDALEQLLWAFSVVEGAVTRKYGNPSLIVDTTAVDFTAADRAKLDTLHDTRLTAGRAANLDNLDATVSSRATPAQVNTEVDAALDTAIPATPTANSINERVKALDDLLQAGGAGDAAAVLTDTGSLNDTKITTARANNLDNLDATVSSRATPAQVNTEVDTALADVNLDHLAGTATAIPAIPPGTYIDQMMDDGTAVYDRTTDSLQAIRDRGDAAWGGGAGSESRNREGTAQAGGANTITLDAGASAVTDFYKHQRCFLNAGTGAGQAQIIDSYNGTTKVATMAASWATAPDATSQFRLLPLGTIPGASAPTAAVVAAAVWNESRTDHDSANSMGEAQNDAKAFARNKQIANKATGETKVMKDDGTTVRFKHTIQQPTDNEVHLVPT
jgi:hypothetical protein